MKQNFLKTKRKLGNFTAFSMMLFLSLLWVSTAKSQNGTLGVIDLTPFNSSSAPYALGNSNSVGTNYEVIVPLNSKDIWGSSRWPFKPASGVNVVDNSSYYNVTTPANNTTAVSSSVTYYGDALFRYGLIPGGSAGSCNIGSKYCKSCTLSSPYNNVAIVPPLASGSTGTAATTQATAYTDVKNNGQYLQFAVRPTTGYRLSLTAIRLAVADNGTTTPDYWTIQGSTDGGSTFSDIATITSSGPVIQPYQINLPSAFASLAGNTPAVFRIYLYGLAGGGTNMRLSENAALGSSGITSFPTGSSTLNLSGTIYNNVASGASVTVNTATSGSGAITTRGIEIDGTSSPALSSPTISSLETTNIDAGTAGPQTIYIDGTNFDATATTAKFNGITHNVNWVNATQISIDLTTADLATAGTYSIVVSNGTGTTDATSNFVVNALPSATISNNGSQPSAGNIAQASAKNILQSFALAVGNNNVTLNSLVAHFAGTYTTSDITNFKLYSSSTNSISTATLLSTANSNTTNASNSTSGSENVTFTLTSNNSFNVGNTYFWIVTSPSSNANIASPVSTINATALATTDFTFATGTKSGSVSAGGTQTIVQGITAYMDDISNQPSGTIAQNSKVALAGFTINPGASTTFTAVNVYANGSATSTDITSLSIYKDVNADGIYEAGTDVLVSTNTPTFSTSATTPMAFTLNETISSKTQYLLVATIADVFVSSINHTVQLSINDVDFTTSIPASNNMNGANSLTIGAPIGTSIIASGNSAATISSLATTTGTSTAVYSFTYHNDNTNTSAASLISKIIIGQGASNNNTLFSDWTKIIGGASLSDGTNTLTGTVSANAITFPSIPTTSGSLGYVATNTTKTYTLSIYLASSLSSAIQQSINGSKLAFALSTSSFTVTGSTLAASQSINSGSNGAISVVPTKLAYVIAPTGGIPNANLSPAITVQAEDVNGNYATGYTGSITISSNPSGISGTLTATATNGLATFGTLQFPTIGTYSVTATDATYSVSSNCSIVNALFTGNSAGTAYSWETAGVWGTNSTTTSGTNWIDGYDAYFGNTKGSTITVGSNHSTPSLNFVTTGYTLTGTGTLNLGSTPVININGAATLASPLTTSGNLSINETGTTSILTVGNATATSASANNYYANFAGTTTVGSGFSSIALKTNNPFGQSASNTLIWNAPSGSSLSFTGAESYTAPASIFPISIASNIVLPTGCVVTVGPTGASVYGNLIKYMGSISGSTAALNFSNSNGYGTSGKGNVYFGAQNTYTGSTLMYGNNASLVLGGGDNTLPAGTDVVFWTGATGYPVIDLRGSNETVSSISTVDATTSQNATTLHGEGFFNGSLMLPSYAVTSSSVTVKTSDVAGFTANGTLVFGAGIPYGTVVSGTSTTTIGTDACTVLALSTPSGKSITPSLLATGFPVFFESPSQVYKTLTIAGTGISGGSFGTSNTINRTISKFNGTINGKINLALAANNNSSNVLTLGNANTYTGSTTVTSGTLVLAHVGGNTIPVADSIIVNGGTLEIKTSQTVSNVNLSAGTLLVDAGDTLTITGYFTNTGGTITNNGTIIYNGGAFTQNGSTIANNGKFNVTTGNFNIAAGTFTIASSDSLTVTNSTINVTGGTVVNNGGILAATNLTVSGGVFTQNVNQTFNNVSVTSKTATLNIGTSTNPTVLINGTLTYGGNITNSGNPITYGASGTLVYTLGNKYQINNASEFVAPSLPSTVTVSAGDTVVLDQDYVFPGSLINNGVITSVGTYLGAHKLSLTGTSNLSGNGSIAVLEINKAGGTITNTGTDSLKIINKLILTNGTLVSNGKITIKSTSLDSTAIVDVVTGGSVSGNVVSERFIPAGFRAFRDMAPGVNTTGTIFSNWQENGATTPGYGLFITGSKNASAGVDATSGLDYTTTGAASAETYRNATWYIYNNNAAYGTPYYTRSGTYSALDYHYGYRLLVRGDRNFNLGTYTSAYYMANATKLRTVGTLVTGNVDYTNYVDNDLNSYSMIGNPYLSPIDWNAIQSDATNSHSNLTSTYYFVTRNDSSHGVTGAQGSLSSIATYDPFFGYVNCGAGSQYIMPGQAFFVQNDGSGTTGTFVIKESHKAAGNSRKQYGVFGISPLGTPSNLFVTLYKQTDPNVFGQADQVKLLVSSSLTSNGVGTNKLKNASDNLSIIEGTKVLSIDGYKALTTADTITLSVDQLTTATPYKLKVDATAFTVSGVTPMLLDRFTKTTTALVGDTAIISFTPTTATDTFGKRFAIVFKASGLPVKEITVSATKESDDVKVNWNTVAEVKVASYTVQSSTNGTSFTDVSTVAANNASSASYTYADINSTASYYRIKATDFTGAVSYSNVAVVFANEITKISAYPNPLVGNTLHLSTSSLSAGKYSVVLYNTIGQKVFESQIDGSIATHDLNTGSLSAGHYNLVISIEGKVAYNTSLQVK